MKCYIFGTGHNWKAPEGGKREWNRVMAFSFLEGLGIRFWLLWGIEAPTFARTWIQADIGNVQSSGAFYFLQNSSQKFLPLIGVVFFPISGRQYG